MSKIYQKEYVRRKNQPKARFCLGFTLIELLVVVLIIGILAAVAVPTYQKAVKRAQYAQLVTVTEAIYRAQQVYKMANGVYTFDFNALDISLPADMRPVLSSSDGRVYQMRNEKMYCMFASTGNLDLAGAVFVTCTSTTEPALIYYIPLATGKRYCGAKTGVAEAEEWCQYMTQKQTRSGRWGENSLYLFD